MNKRYAVFITALFCAFIGVFLLAGLITPDRTFSPLENRNLQQFPKLTLAKVKDGSFMREFETYVTDQFFGRDAWIAAKAVGERILGKQENNGVYLCKNDTLITRFDPPDEALVAKNLAYVEQFAQKSGIPVYFSLIPGAVSIWADRLPAGAPNADQKAILDQGQAAAPSARWYDTYTPLWDHRGEDIYYRTDHHWTSLGAYYGYTALAQALGFSPVPLSDYTKTTVSQDFYGTIYSSSGVRWVKPDVIDTYVPDTGITVTSYTYDKTGRPVEEPRPLYDTSYLEVKDKYSMFLGGNQSLAVVRTQNAGPKIAIIRDSYADSLVPFLTAHCSEIHLIDLRYYKLSLSEYLTEHQIGAAVVLYSAANFASDQNFLWLTR
ncbi:MAG: hypothetical protein HFE97_03970 [Oscillospiraceae bacterium]|nr:hypothetical protein [Oscillospiraceae bacterium]